MAESRAVRSRGPMEGLGRGPVSARFSCAGLCLPSKLSAASVALDSSGGAAAGEIICHSSHASSRCLCNAMVAALIATWKDNIM